MTTKTNRIKYRFTLNLPAAFTIRTLRDMRHDLRYITAVKRIDAGLADGTIKEVGKFRKKAQRGRMQKVYVLANVTNVMLELENAQFTKGDLILA